MSARGYAALAAPPRIRRSHAPPPSAARARGTVETAPALDTLDFDLPDELSAREPPEARGLPRDAVRLLVTEGDGERVTHAHFRDLPRFLSPGDLVVVNASATLATALEGIRKTGDGDAPILVHLSTPLEDGRWVIELRRATADGNEPLLDARAGERIYLRGGGAATLAAPYLPPDGDTAAGRVRLWVAEMEMPGGADAYLAAHGEPIRYRYVPRAWPLAYYQTVFAAEPGSAEMPSAGRAFTHETVRALRAKGIGIAPLVLHAGVASLEADEPPYPERYRVPAATAEAVNRARAAGGRIVAVGTTVVRALETVANAGGTVRAGAGWTDLVVTPERGVRAVDALLTGLHAPRASHLAMLEAIAGRVHLARAYDAALRRRYLWHEFGDLHLILPRRG
ncbi:MAG TPA: S-adenosylmethionine:tRNA ribosyltransferase-isomerase [Longimicrobium sp.]